MLDWVFALSQDDFGGKDLTLLEIFFLEQILIILMGRVQREAQS